MLRRSSRILVRFFSEQPRVNPVGIQYLSESLQRQVFGSNTASHKSKGLTDKEKLVLTTLSKKYLAANGLLGKKTNISEPLSFELPPLKGSSLDEHFQKIGMYAAEPYLTWAKNKFTDIPRMPTSWEMKSGWYRYAPGSVPEKVEYPLEDTIVFDVEVQYKVSDYPVIATAVSEKAWYGWVSPYLTGESVENNHLIPLNTNKEKLIIGHNIGYDRARVLEEYNINDTKGFFMDTMSLHVATSGLCSRQRGIWLKHNKLKNKESEEESDSLRQEQISVGEDDDPWLNLAAMNSLKHVAKFHCDIDMDKGRREIMATEDKQELIDNFQILMDYCGEDVSATSKVFDATFPKFIKNCPHPVSFAALKFMGSCFLPTTKKWHSYVENSERIWQESVETIENQIIESVDEAIKMKPEDGMKDPWLSQLDWTHVPVKILKNGTPSKTQKLGGYPQWYRELFKSRKCTKPHVSIRSRQTPLFFKLKWEGYPIVWTDSQGWCFEVPQSEEETMKSKNYIVANLKDDPKKVELANKYFDKVLFKVPHPDGPDSRCTHILAKGYGVYFEKGVMTSESKYAHEALEMGKAGSYWMSARERIKSQFVVFKDDIGMIIPKLIPMGTVTRRAVEQTWLTASNAKKNRIGSELKSMIEAPPGYSFVGADVDSEELWIASLLGDSVFNIHGGTAIGWMCLEGTKNEGTDLHSKTAKILGISRNEAKIFNYGRIYGAGVKFATTLLKQFNPTLSDKQAAEVAQELYKATKGQTLYSNTFSKFWFGGSESILFNKLENVAEQDEPRTPVLGAGITASLQKKNLNSNSFLPSRINWTIQSSGVDYLHLLCVAMNYLIKTYNIDARLAISVHDEIRYLVKNNDKYRAAMALQVANIWTRAIFCQQIGIDDLPQNCAFFSAVDIDHVLRKEVDMDCITPSNPTPIPHGESLDINALLSKEEAKLVVQNSIDLDSYSYVPREPILEKYNKQYTKEFLEYFLRMQIVEDKKEVYALQRAYVHAKREKELADIFKDEEEYQWNDQKFRNESKSAKKENKKKLNIVDESYHKTSSVLDNAEKFYQGMSTAQPEIIAATSPTIVSKRQPTKHEPRKYEARKYVPRKPTSRYAASSLNAFYESVDTNRKSVHEKEVIIDQQLRMKECDLDELVDNAISRKPVVKSKSVKPKFAKPAVIPKFTTPKKKVTNTQNLSQHKKEIPHQVHNI